MGALQRGLRPQAPAGPSLHPLHQPSRPSWAPEPPDRPEERLWWARGLLAIPEAQSLPCPRRAAVVTARRVPALQQVGGTYLIHSLRGRTADPLRNGEASHLRGWGRSWNSHPQANAQAPAGPSARVSFQKGLFCLLPKAWRGAQER